MPFIEQQDIAETSMSSEADADGRRDTLQSKSSKDLVQARMEEIEVTLRQSFYYMNGGDLMAVMRQPIEELLEKSSKEILDEASNALLHNLSAVL